MKSVNELKAAAKEHAARLVDEIKAADGAWDDDYIVALVKHKYSKWMGEAARDVATANAVAVLLNSELGMTQEDWVGVAWFEERTHKRRLELIDDQERATNDIDEAKAALEMANEAKKAAQATIDTEHSRLRNLARELKKPYVFPLPFTPPRQRELPLGDGEEWRAVPLSEVLKSDVALKSTALDKLGDVNLGQYADLAQKFSLGMKPQKLTRKQWDRVEALVQQWHAERTEEVEHGDDEGDEGDEGDE